MEQVSWKTTVGYPDIKIGSTKSGNLDFINP